MKPAKDPTFTSRIEAYLREADDFRRTRDIADALKLDAHLVCTCLSTLRTYKAVATIEQPDALWWFLTPETDTRLLKLKGRVMETKRRKTRPKAANVHPFKPTAEASE